MNVFGVGLFLVTLTGAWDLAVESGETRAKIVTESVLLRFLPFERNVLFHKVIEGVCES